MPSTRRDALRATGGVLSACLAGCTGLFGADQSTNESPPHGDPVTSYDTARQVVDGEKRLFHWTGRDDRPNDQLFISTPEERSAVEFDIEGQSSVAAFVTETDLSTSSLVLFQRRHNACQRLGTFGISERPDELRVHLCREPRPADEECQNENQRSTLLALRVPLDGTSLSGLSVVESSPCENRFGPYRDGGEH